MRHLFIIILSFSVVACKEIELQRIYKIKTVSVEQVGNEFTAFGKFIDIGHPQAEYGFCLSDVAQEPTIDNTKLVAGNATERSLFSLVLNNLLPGKTYYCRAYVLINNNVVYGNVVTFNTNTINVQFSKSALQLLNDEGDISATSTISQIGSLNIAEYGHCWAVNAIPTTDNNKTVFTNLTSDSTFTSTFKNLATNTVLVFRAYAILTDNQIVYSDTSVIRLPVLSITTDTAVWINQNNINFKGSFKEIGIKAINDYGFVWSKTNITPTLNDEVIKVTVTPAVGSFFANLFSVDTLQTYYYRSFATERNSTTISYGQIKTIKK